MNRIGIRAARLACAIVLASITTTRPLADGETPASRVVLENGRVRVHAILYPPGSVTPQHVHRWPRVVVVIEGGRLEIRDAGGETLTIQIEPGQVVWRPAEEHVIANVGSTPIRLVEIDLLDAPARRTPRTEP